MIIKATLSLDVAESRATDDVVMSAAQVYAESIKGMPMRFDFGIIGSFTAIVTDANLATLETRGPVPAPNATAEDAKSLESPPAASQGQSECPYSIGDVLRRIMAGGKYVDWTVVEIISADMTMVSDAMSHPSTVDWREIETSPEWLIHKKAE